MLSFGLWVHHMFTAGLPHLGMNFFSAASMMIAIPSGVQIFCWIASLWGAKIRSLTPMLFVLGFFFIFVIGGLTGVMVASVPFDTQVHDTYFRRRALPLCADRRRRLPVIRRSLLLVSEAHREN
jgi:cytochrome c oxidase subunit I+III